ncbi:hypothetical protein K2173_005652 [Erythroxylum novogranatense]|uniref:IMS import disulfide relay-system CHCH-CHCH-like Cx9C domain-containing protein n=1 Tax=Erythroxylum novogranatense TaxID=1862640 RepID=A0AAV8SQD3_9ROSI|nr:hypothetical protein K2173_005652 [Erythroxylum novogranatense]
MKERNTSTTLRHILVNCASQAKEYGSCVAAKVPDVEHDMCLKEFLALKLCMQNTYPPMRCFITGSRGLF